MASHNIQQISRRFRQLFLIIAIALPLLTLFYWVLFNYLPQGLRPLQPYVIGALPWTTASLALLASLLPLSVVVFGLVTLVQLFRLYENAIYFSHETVTLFRRLGITLMLWVVASPLHSSLLSIAVTFNNPPGERMLVMTLDFGDLAMLLIGTIVILISWIMEEGRKLEEEQAYTV